MDIMTRLLAAAFVLAALTGCEKDQSTDSQAQTGMIAVSSEPSGARICLNGEDTEEATPHTLKNIAEGPHALKLTLEHHADWDTLVVVECDEVTIVHAILISTIGAIAVSSDPSGASIYLDGADTYRTTPDTLIKRGVGSHTITLELTDYADWTDTVHVGRDSLTVIEAILTRATGTLIIASTPDGAEISLDNMSTGFVTPHTFDSILTGTYLVTLMMSDYQEWSHEVLVEADKTSEVSAELEPLPGQLAVLSSPSRAEIWFGEENTTFTTPHTFDSLEPGSYQLKLFLDDYAEWTCEVIVVGDSLTVIEATLTPLTGGLFVTSTPSGANIWRDEAMTSFRTPHTFDSLETGIHYLRLTKYGYHDWTGDALVEEHLTTELNAVLEPTYGSLYVSSTPPGAAIALDGILTSEVTPATISGINVDSHLVELSLTGYVSWSENVWIGSDSLSAVEAVLVRVTGTLVISSNPPGATIWLADTNAGFVTPHTFDNLDPGTYSIKLTLSNYRDWVDEATVEALHVTEITAVLEPAYGSLAVNSTPSGANIWLDEATTSVTTPHTFPELFPGSYRIRLTKPTYKEWSQDVVVEAEQTTIVNAELEQLPTVLVIASTPSGAEVWIDGDATGEKTPATLTGLDPGLHIVRMLYPDYFPWGTEIELSLAETRHISADLDPAPAHTIAYTIGDTVWVSRLDGVNSEKLAEDFRFVHSGWHTTLGDAILWSPDGRHFVYSSHTGVTVLENGAVKSEMTFTSTRRADDLSWSHSSRYLAWGSYYDGVYLYDAVLNEHTRILRSASLTYDHNPLFSSGDSLILFVHHEHGSQSTLYLMEEDGSDVRRVSEMFRSVYDEHLDLSWFSDSEVLLKENRSPASIRTIDVFGGMTAPTTLIETSTVKLAVSKNQSLFAYATTTTLYYGTVGDWTPIELTTFPVIYHFAWSPENDGLLCRTNDGVWWVFLDGTKHQIVKTITSLGNGRAVIKP